ncbi:MAG: GNAT family N-acetyltransferase [Anaerolineales bacterium]
MKPLHLTLHRSFDSLETLSHAWNNLLAESVTNAPFLRYEYLCTWWNTRGGGEWPPEAELRVYTAEQEGQLLGVAPLFLAKGKLWLLGSVEISDHLDLIARPQTLPAFVAALLAQLEQDPAENWSALEWVNLPDWSPTPALLQSEAEKHGWHYSQEIYQPTPYISLPGNFETYLEGIDKKQRHELRRKMRRAEESGRGVRWYIVRDEAALESEIEAFLHLMSQEPEKNEFLTEAMRDHMGQSLHAAFRAEWLQLAFLEIDGKKACGYINFDYNNRIWVYNTGLDRSFMELSPGWVLLGHLLQWANENGRAEFDFLRGDEEYKYKLGGQNRFVLKVSVERNGKSNNK